MSRFYFLEQLDPQRDYSDGTLVSLTPAVSYALEKKGFPFHILRRNEEDLQMRGNDDAFFLKQIDWVKRFDQIIQQEVPFLKENGIRAAYHHFSKLKFVMDTLMVYALEAKQFLEKHKAQSLVYVGEGETDFSAPSIFDLRKNGHQAYLEILKLVCKQMGIAFSISAVQRNTTAPVSGSFWTNTAKPVLKSMGFKQWFHFFKYSKWKTSVRSSQNSAPGVLFLDAGSEKIDHVIKAFVSKSMRIYTLVGRDIFEYSSVNETRAASLDVQRQGIPDLSQAAQKIAADKSLYGIFQEKLSWDLSSVFAPYLRHFIREIIPGVAADYLALKEFCSEHRIEMMVAQGSSGKQYTAALNLAKNSDAIKSVCFQHSCGPTYWRDWIFGELDYFHYFMTTDSLHDAFFKKMSDEPWLSECLVQESPFYLKKLRDDTAQQRNNRTVLYIPRKQSMRISKFNSYLYPLTWLYEIQKAVLDVFGKYPEIPVIYKHHPSSKWAEASILKYLEEKGYKNISVQQGSLKTFFDKAERVFMDYPSTPLFEAAASGLPVLAIYPSVDRIIQEMNSFFGNSLQGFSSAQEAAQQVETFLTAPAEAYRKEIPFSSDDALETLTQAMAVTA